MHKEGGAGDLVHQPVLLSSAFRPRFVVVGGYLFYGSSPVGDSQRWMYCIKEGFETLCTIF
jgi:hypothetical protein